MTTKEISKVANVSQRMAQLWAKSLSEKISSISEKISSSSPTHPANFTLEETCEIIRAGGNETLASLLMENAERSNQPVQNGQDDNGMSELKTMFKELMKMNMSLIQNQLKPQLEYKQDYYSIIGYANFKGQKNITVSEARELSVVAKKMCIEKGLTVRKIPDERWGTANSYPIDVLEKVFEL